LDVSMTDDAVTLRASIRHEEKEEKGEYYRREMSRGEFQRTLRLPAAVKGEQAKATFKDGILELVLPKMEQAKRKTIRIE
jgi:HSP20 family protein